MSGAHAGARVHLSARRPALPARAVPEPDQLFRGSLEFSLVGLQNFENVVRSPCFSGHCATPSSSRSSPRCSSSLWAMSWPRFSSRTSAPRSSSASSSSCRGQRPSLSPLSAVDLRLHLQRDQLGARGGGLGPGQWYYWLGDSVLGIAAITTVHVWRLLMAACLITGVPWPSSTTSSSTGSSPASQWGRSSS